VAEFSDRLQGGSFLTPEKTSDPDSPLQKTLAAISLESLQYRATLINAIHPMENGMGQFAMRGLLEADYLPAGQKQALQAMHNHFSAIAGLGEGGSDITGAGVERLAKFHAGEQQDLILADAAKKYAAENFRRIDINGDGSLQHAELLNNKEVSAGDEKILATYLLQREDDIAGLSPDASRGFIARNTELEHGIMLDDVNAMTATAMTDAMIANHYLRREMAERQSTTGKAYGMWNGGYYNSRDHADIRAFLKELPGDSQRIAANQRN
jgi:hypothetical protein